MSERDAIVAWLRGPAFTSRHPEDAAFARHVALAIERGDHLPASVAGDAIVAVTEADREAAAMFFQGEGMKPGVILSDIRAGHMDDLRVVKAFARHRSAENDRCINALRDRIAVAKALAAREATDARVAALMAFEVAAQLIARQALEASR